MPASPARVIGHRGASALRPEHTLESYRKAIEDGADIVEPDLVSTRDGVLVARHENEISGTTDVAAHPEFAARKATKTLDGERVTGWFTEDFTLAEIKTLRAKQPRAYRAAAWDGIYEIPTLQQVIDLAKAASAELGREICIYPETKHPTYFADHGLDIDAALVAVLDRNGLNQPTSPVFIQSFETGNLKKLKGMTGVRLVQLMDDFDTQPYDLAKAGAKTTYRDLMQPAALAEIATYAYGIGPWKRTILPETDGVLGAANALVADAHAAGLAPLDRHDEHEPQRRLVAAHLQELLADHAPQALTVHASASCSETSPSSRLPSVERISARSATCGVRTSIRLPPRKSMPRLRPRTETSAIVASSTNSDQAKAMWR